MSPYALMQERPTRGDLCCLLCNRMAGTAEGYRGGPLTIRPLEPWHAEAVERLRCPHCGGRLQVEGAEPVRDARRPLTNEQMTPRRGRPPREIRR